MLTTRLPLTILSAFLFAAVIFLIFIVPNTFTWDDWDIYANFIMETGNNGLLFSNLWVPTNGHRVLLPRMLFYFQHFFSYSPKVFMVLNILLFSAAYLIFYKKYLLTSAKNAPFQFLFLLMTSLFFLNYAQSDNFYWMSEISWSISFLCLVICVFSFFENKMSLFCMSLLVVFLSSANWFTISFSILTTCAFIKIFKRSEDRVSLTPLVLLALLILTGWYVAFSSESTGAHPASPLKTFQFFVYFLGMPFQILGRGIAWIMGAVFLGATLTLVLTKKTKLTSFEFCFLIFALIFAGIVALARADLYWKIGEKMAYRYVTLLIPGWLVLIAHAHQTFRSQRFLQLALVAVIFININGALVQKFYLDERAESKKCIDETLLDRSLLDKNAPCLKHVHQDYTRIFEMEARFRDFKNKKGSTK